jgi:outer membrane lipoprotein-sorting protein
MKKVWRYFALTMAVLVVSCSVYAEDISKDQMKGLDEQVQDIKGDVLGIAAQLTQLEEKLLYPSDTQVAVFVSLFEGEKFRLDGVSIELGGKSVANHLYTFKELEAFQKGGVQRIYTGNVTTGDHDLQVTLIGKSESGADLLRTKTFTFNKAVGPKIVEIILAENSLGFRDW